MIELDMLNIKLEKIIIDNIINLNNMDRDIAIKYSDQILNQLDKIVMDITSRNV